MASIDDARPFSGQKAPSATSALWAGQKMLIAVLAALILSRFLLAGFAELAEDETYYWLWSRHLAAGYYDHPPMVAYWIAAGTALFGDTAFGVRFIGLVSVLAGSVLLYQASLSLFRNRTAAALSVIWLNATLLTNAAAILATPDTPLAFFTMLTIFALAKLIETGRGVWWLAIGAALGAAFASKYTAAFLLPGLFIWMIASPAGRRWFLRPEPYIGALVAFAIIAPVVYWNYSHDWASFAKQLEHSIKDKPASAVHSVAEFIGGQAGLATPLMFAFSLFGSGFALWRGLTRADPRWLLLGAMAAPAFVFFLIHSASQKIQPNWPGFIYPAAVLAGVHAFLELSKERPVAPWARACFKAAPWVGAAFSAAAFLQLGFSALPLDAKKDPTSRLKGWAKLGADIEQAQRANGASWILTTRYATTGELAYYMRQPGAVLQASERIRYANLPAPDENQLKDKTALLVLRHGEDASRFAPYFASTRLVTTLLREAGFRPRDAYDVYVLTFYRGGLFAGPPSPQIRSP